LVYSYTKGNARSSYLPTQRPTALTRVEKKERATRVVIANEKKTARPQIEEVLNLKPISAFDLKKQIVFILNCKQKYIKKIRNKTIE